MIVIAAILTYIIPAGEFDRQQIEGTSRAVVVAGSYHRVAQSPVSFIGMFKAIPLGFAASANIIAMILFSAGAFQVVLENGKIENVLGSLLNKVGNKKHSGTIVIWIVTFIFSIMGIFIGPEVHVPFTIVTVAVALGMGYDLIVGMAMVLGGCIGFATAPINASTIGTCDAISGLPFQSLCDGKMHACGHDAHTTWLLGTAMILSRLRGQLCGNVKFMFQPAEENPGGADEMIHEGLLRDPDVDFAMGAHVNPTLPAGSYLIEDGPVTSNPDFFRITIRGKGSHGSAPQDGIDAIAMGVKIYNLLETFVSRLSDPCEPLVLSVCRISGGTSRGI